MTGSDETSVDTRGVAHAVEIEKMIIQNHAGQNVDVRAMFSEYTSVSSLFEPGIHGSVTIHDAHSLLTRHPIVGEETLHVSFKTPGNEPKTHQFAIWRVTDETPDDKGTASVYTLHFCAKAMLRNASKVIAKSYTDTDDAKSILRSIAAEGLLRRTPAPTEAEIRRAIAGNICRCTGYANIVRAIARTASERVAGERP